MERATIESDSLVLDNRMKHSGILSRAGHVKSCLNPAGPSAKLNTRKRPIANQYREGKVKSTSVRGVKKFLKPYAYKRSEQRKL